MDEETEASNSIANKMYCPSLQEVAEVRDISVFLEWGCGAIKEGRGRNIRRRVISPRPPHGNIDSGFSPEEENLGVPSHWIPVSHLHLALHQPSITNMARDSSGTTRTL